MNWIIVLLDSYGQLPTEAHGTFATQSEAVDFATDVFDGFMWAVVQLLETL